MSSVLGYSILFIAGYLGITLTLFMLSNRSSIASFLARLLAAYLSLIVCSVYGVTASIILRLVGNVQISQWATARSFKYVMWLTTGVTFVIDDPNDYLGTTRPAVLIGNHQSELDVLMLGCIFPKYCSVTAKKSLKNMPFLGWFMSLSGSIFIDRANSNDARAAMAGAATEMTTKQQSVYMFPEGTRSYSKEPMLLPFKKGAFHLAVQAGVPIIPVVVANYSTLLHVMEWRFNSGSVPVKVLKPIETKNLKPSDVNNLAKNTQDLMLKELLTLTSEYRGKAIATPIGSANNGVMKASGTDVTNAKSH